MGEGEPGLHSNTMPERFSVAIIGSGISGLSQAISLQNTLGDAVDILVRRGEGPS